MLRKVYFQARSSGSQNGEKRLAVLEKGQCFGEMAYLTGEARTATIITKEECILLK
ncbi:MAG: cyclic nucleotide-binding domain-containing protein, partial [Deltaproteobacteria bacterium]|nr:cyclic nucleotide-binding domain-containing protein [Deltaproteobacteria bacterium]